MGQVPAARHPIGIVGDGRVAAHFLHYLALLEVPTRSWSRRTSTAAPPDALSDCSTILLLVRDDAIVPFTEAWPALRQKRLVHFSGSLGTPVAHAAHPLMTFGSELYDLATYRRIPFVLDAGGPALEELLPDLPNPWFSVARAERAYYHALCVMAGTFSTLLWLKLFREFENRLGIPGSAAHPYLLQTMKNLLSSPDGAFTGPVSRGDEATIAANLKALEGDPFHAVYLAFARTYERRS